MVKKPVVVVYVRHREDCPKAFTKEIGRYGNPKPDESWPKCDCPKWLRYSVGGKQKRVNAHTRTWGLAEEKAAELQKQVDAGVEGKLVAAVAETQPTIAQAVETFITAKEGAQISDATIRKLRFQLGQFEQFMGRRSKHFPAEVTATDVIEFRAGWTYKSGVTKQKAQQNLRGYLRSCCRENLADLLRALDTIKLSKADRKRTKPQPFTERELTHLLAQVPKTFPDGAKAAKMTALIHCMVSTGLAIRDTVQLERNSLCNGWLSIERQKTGRPVHQKLDDGLHRELMAVANGNPKYIFWSGASKATSTVGAWQADLRDLMRDAGLWIKGNLSHRFRDTAVDFWLGAGCDLTVIASMLGDTVPVVSKHYADLASERNKERLAKLPTRTWSANV